MHKLEKYLSGENLDTYKRKRETWLLSSIVSIFFPFAISIIVGICSNNINLINIFSQGDIIILFYSLTITILFDLWNTPKDNRKNDNGIQRTFYVLLIVLFSQMALYGVIKTNAIDNIWFIFIITTIIIISSYFACNSALLQIFLYNIQEV